MKLNADLAECLRTYDILGLWRDAEDVLRREVVRGFVKKVRPLIRSVDPFLNCEQTIYTGALAAPHSPILPHTPFPGVKAPSFSSSAYSLPRTPYTPFTARLSLNQNPTQIVGHSASSPYAHLLEDTEDPLAKLYTQILRFIERDLRRIMDLAERVSVKSLTRFPSEVDVPELSVQKNITSDGKRFEIMANVIWEEMGQAIMKELGGIVFSAGRPDDFRRVRFRNLGVKTKPDGHTSTAS